MIGRLSASPAIRELNSSIRAGLAETGDAYEQMATAAENRHADDYDRARRSIRRSNAKVRRALNSLERRGYRVG